MKKALVISGGGALGAYGGGVAEALIKIKKRQYDLIVGTSTGSLLSPLIATGDFEKLKEAYTSVNQKSIFDFNPFNCHNKISLPKAVIRMILKKLSLGDSNNLRKVISQFFSEEDYAKVLKNKVELVACVTNLNTKTAEYKSILDNSYEDICDWLWISANAPTFMSTVKKNGDYYVDGGIKQHTPAQIAIDSGADEIDIIVHRTIDYKEEKRWEPKNFFDTLMRTIQILAEEVSLNDIEITKLEANEKNVKINIYYLPRKLTENSLIFDKKIMTDWWNEGYQNTKFNLSKESYLLTTDGEIKKTA